jgi:hypothetical protein
MTVVINGTTGIDTGTGSLIAANSTTPTYLDLFEDTDNGSNYVRLIAPTSVASNRTITLPDGTGTVAVSGVSGVLVSGTAVASTSGTSVEFTGIPSYAKQIIVMFQGVSASSTGVIQVQIGSGSYTISGYLSGASNYVGYSAVTTGFGCAYNSASTSLWHGAVRLTILNPSANSWVSNGILNDSSAGAQIMNSAGSISLSGTLDRVRVIASATGSPSDTFDAGTINIIWE